jgi:hypothetical protein
MAFGPWEDGVWDEAVFADGFWESVVSAVASSASRMIMRLRRFRYR